MKWARTTDEIVTVTEAQWREEGARRFGEDMLKWRFVCPMCEHEAAVSDWKDAGASEGAVAFSCVGRWLPGDIDEDEGPCVYAGGGLFGLNPVRIVSDDGTEHRVFAFADVSSAAEPG